MSTSSPIWTPDSELAAAALRGPWQAVLTDDHGQILEAPESAGYVDSARIAVVRGEVPLRDWWFPEDTPWSDRLYLFKHLTDLDDIATRWEQAQAVAAGLNAIAAGGAQ